MAAIIGSLRAELSASIAQFQSDMGAAADAVKKFGKEAKAVAKDITETGAQMSIALSLPLIELGKKSVDAAEEAADAQAQLQAAIKSTGNTAGKTTTQLQGSAEALAEISKYNKDDILRNVTTNLLTFGNIQGPIFDKAQLAVVNLSARMGNDLQGAAIKVGRALQDPIKGITAFTRLGLNFTDQQKLQIKALVQNGEGFKAQGIILDALASKFDGAAKAQLDASPTDQMQKAWHEFAETIGTQLIPLLTDLAGMLKVVLGWFNSLSPGMQKFVVIVGLIVAVIGPMLVEIATLIKLLGFLAPLLGTVLTFVAGLEIATIGWVAALVAVVVALGIFWKSVVDVLHGDFGKAWDDAKDTASKIAADIKGIFATVPTGPTGKPADAGSNDAQSQKPNFNLDNAADIKKAAEAAKQFQLAITQMNQKISLGLGELTLPKATTQANALNDQITNFVQKAKDAGVNTTKWAGQIDGLRVRIEALKQAALAKEAQAFSDAVDKQQTAVDKFSKGGLPELQEKLNAVDDEYKQHQDDIEKLIADNAVLATSNDVAAQAMGRLKGQLSDLADAHDKARKAAASQVATEQQLQHLSAISDLNEANNAKQDLQQGKGIGTPLGSNATAVQQAQRDLDAQAIASEQKLDTLAQQRRDLEKTGTEEQLADLDKNIAAQRELGDEIENTTAEQLVAAKKISDAFSTFADDLSQNLADMISNWDGSLKNLGDTFKKLAEQLFIKPGTDALSSSITGGIKDIFSDATKSGAGGSSASGGGIMSSLSSLWDSFSGFFASGGSLSPGEWGIAGENGPEPIQGGRYGLGIMSNKDAAGLAGNRGGTVVNQYITTPDASSFRASSRQVARQAKSSLGMAGA